MTCWWLVRALDLMRSGAVGGTPLISDSYPLDAVDEAFEVQWQSKPATTRRRNASP